MMSPEQQQKKQEVIQFLQAEDYCRALATLKTCDFDLALSQDELISQGVSAEHARRLLEPLSPTRSKLFQANESTETPNITFLNNLRWAMFEELNQVVFPKADCTSDKTLEALNTHYQNLEINDELDLIKQELVFGQLLHLLLGWDETKSIADIEKVARTLDCTNHLNELINKEIAELEKILDDSLNQSDIGPYQETISISTFNTYRERFGRLELSDLFTKKLQSYQEAIIAQAHDFLADDYQGDLTLRCLKGKFSAAELLPTLEEMINARLQQLQTRMDGLIANPDENFEAEHSVIQKQFERVGISINKLDEICASRARQNPEYRQQETQERKQLLTQHIEALARTGERVDGFTYHLITTAHKVLERNGELAWLQNEMPAIYKAFENEVSDFLSDNYEGTLTFSELEDTFSKLNRPATFEEAIEAYKQAITTELQQALNDGSDLEKIKAKFQKINEEGTFEEIQRIHTEQQRCMDEITREHNSILPEEKHRFQMFKHIRGNKESFIQEVVTIVEAADLPVTNKQELLNHAAQMKIATMSRFGNNSDDQTAAETLRNIAENLTPEGKVPDSITYHKASVHKPSGNSRG